MASAMHAAEVAVARERRRAVRDARNWAQARYPNEEILEVQASGAKVWLVLNDGRGGRVVSFPDDV